MTQPTFPNIRMRRLRNNPTLRTMLREITISTDDLILPLFIHHGSHVKNPISSMPGHFQLSIDQLNQEIEEIQTLGIKSVILFGIPEKKDALGSDSCHDAGIIQQAIQKIKKEAPELLVIADTCFCEYTDHGHCGVISDYQGEPHLDNDATLEILAQQAVSFAKAGADIIAPSGMIDGMVKTLRHHLDQAGFSNLPILSYAVKYASAFYGPFREAAEGSPQFGDRKSYQMDPANRGESLREAAIDIAEGADMLMVKPALAYLDIISKIKEHHPGVPLAAYQVSGEFAMIKAAATNGWIDERDVALESLLAIKRAGADLIISYFAKDVAKWL